MFAYQPTRQLVLSLHCATDNRDLFYNVFSRWPGSSHIHSLHFGHGPPEENDPRMS